MKHLISVAVGVILFAAIHPAEVHAQTVEEPKTFIDAIVPIYEPTQAIQYMELPEYAAIQLLEKKESQVKPRPITDSSNTYTPGNCTWYAKSKRPDLPNNLGNADTWYARAQDQGIPVGTEPRVGAVGMTKAYMHVVWISGVNGDTVLISEMNYEGLGVVSSRTAPASEFLYVY